ncbi:unnamed protein product (macronuclear) [Paramecium tetraurelia]|uniref:DUF676 domain-containing protein n=1 Tax=Paramecium tetraurelia TaxID=5888 RepID=A0BTV5_PARTE|nr:uncharacterized protein GSPATT00032204001 [Paramecium tetraurelia]CAK61972.1 unnamed protein product [Paramecium tetraurelia]|eukprot:XP_001429370.1 hypothetical protein (macronuclear) [Paramecium tetraurelia strain d4-2]
MFQSMKSYFEIALLFLPNKVCNYISITKSAYEIVNVIQSKFLPEYQSVMDAQNYQTNNPSLYSQLFKGSVNLETIKRKSIALQQSCLKNIQQFLYNYQFTQELNIIKIRDEFYSKNLNCCIIDLNVISANLPYYLETVEVRQFNEEQLNQTINQLSKFLMEYVEGQFHSESIIKEFQQNFQDIVRDIYKSIIQVAKKQHKEIYDKLTKKIKQFYKNNLNNSALDGACKIIQENNIPLFQIKKFIHNFFAQNLKYFNDELEDFYKFQLSHVVILRYVCKIIDHSLFRLKSSLLIFTKQEKMQQELQLKTQHLFYQYFEKKDFLLIKNKIFAAKLFYLFLQVDLESREFGTILDTLSQYAEITKIDYSQYGSESIIEFRKAYQNEIQSANHFWQKEITEQQNLQLIFDLFILLNGTQFVNGQLLFQEYLSANKNILMKLINLMNDGYYRYFNCKLIKTFEKRIGEIRNQIFNQIEKQKQIVKLSVIIQDNRFFISIFDAYQQSQEQVFNRNQMYFNIKNSLIDNQINQLQSLLIQIQRNYLSKVSIPEKMHFESIQSKLEHSSVVTIFISGFTDIKVQKSILEGLKDQNLIVLNWNNPKEDNDVGENLSKVVKEFISNSPLEIAANLLKAYSNASFEKSCQEAKRVGKYLAYLLIKNKIFGDCQINIIAHSVGSLVMYEMMKELDNMQNTNLIINEILILGGIVDIRKLQKRRWNQVEGRICNVYTQNDLVLKLMYNSFRLQDIFCGLNEVKQGFRRIENYNMSNLIQGHNDYGVHIQNILIQTDFQQYLRFLYE